MEVKLEPAEILIGAFIGVMRQAQNLKEGRKPAYGADDKNDWQKHIDGALGEMAFAKATNRYWSKGKFRGDDVDKFQVRTTREHDHDLMLHKEDKNEKRFYLVTGYNGNYRVQGWIIAREGKQDKWWRDPVGGRPAYFVPQKFLSREGL